MTPVIGIDLGTTNTVVAVVTNGQAAAIPDETGRTLLPSVVSFHPSGNVLVGRDARERRLVDSPDTRDVAPVLGVADVAPARELIALLPVLAPALAVGLADDGAVAALWLADAAGREDEVDRAK